MSDATRYLCQLDTVALADIAVDSQDCSICRTPYGIGQCREAVRLTPCSHIFGRECIALWLSSSHQITSCPMCRQSLFQADVLDEDDVLEGLDPNLIAAWVLAVIEAVKGARRLRKAHHMLKPKIICLFAIVQSYSQRSLRSRTHTRYSIFSTFSFESMQSLPQNCPSARSANR